jgi:hypothetical protein
MNETMTLQYDPSTLTVIPDIVSPYDEQHQTFEHEDSDAGRMPRVKKWLGRIGLVGLGAVSAISAEVNISSLPGHNQVDLAYQLGASDLAAVWHKAPWDRQPEYPYLVDNQSIGPQLFNQLVSNYQADNGLFLSSSDTFFRSYATTWGSAIALDTENILSLMPGPSQNDVAKAFQNSLAAVNKNYWGTVYHSMPGYDSKISAFTTTSFPKFVDDEGWMGLNDMQTPSGLKRAEDVFAIAESQIDKKNGGIYWQVQNSGDSDHTRSLVSNAPTVILGAELYKKTGKISYLRESQTIYKWIQSALYDRSNGMYSDHIYPNGAVDKHIWTYGEGEVAAATAALGNVQLAATEINRDLDYFATHHSYGNPAFDLKYFQAAKWVAIEDGSPLLELKTESALRDAIKAEPKNPTDILEKAGEIGLDALYALPVNQDSKLFFGTVALKAKHHFII